MGVDPTVTLVANSIPPLTRHFAVRRIVAVPLLSHLSASHLSQLVFTGYTLPEINRLPLSLEILHHLDVLIAGRYAAAHPTGQSLLGSANQQIHLMTGRYMFPQLSSVPRHELILHPDATLTATGLTPWRPYTILTCEVVK